MRERVHFESGVGEEMRPSTAPQPDGAQGQWGSVYNGQGIRHILPATSRIVARPRAGRISNTDSGGPGHGDGGSGSHQRRTQTARSGSTTLMGWTSQVTDGRQPEHTTHGGVVQGLRRQMVSARPTGAMKKTSGTHATPRPSTSHCASSSPAGTTPSRGIQIGLCYCCPKITLKGQGLHKAPSKAPRNPQLRCSPLRPFYHCSMSAAVISQFGSSAWDGRSTGWESLPDEVAAGVFSTIQAASEDAESEAACARLTCRRWAEQLAGCWTALRLKAPPHRDAWARLWTGLEELNLSSTSTALTNAQV